MTGESNHGPKLSALVVAHNEEDDLETCLRHLHFVDEIVVLLDRCTDGSKAIAEKFAHKIIEGAWEFEGERRNTGIDACTGPWIIDADADEANSAPACSSSCSCSCSCFCFSSCCC